MGDRSDAYALVYDRYAKFVGNVVADFHQIACIGGNFVVYLFAASIDIAIGAVEQAYSHGDGANIEVFLLNHLVSFVNFENANHNAMMIDVY